VSDQMQSPNDRAPLTARLFTVESALWAVGVVFLFGTGYASITSATEANTKTIEQMQKGQHEIVRDVSTIQSDIASIKATQVAQDRNINKRLDENQATLNRFFRVLQESTLHTRKTH